MDCARIWATPEHTDQELISYSQNESMSVTCIALEALNLRGIEAALAPTVIRLMGGFGDWAVWFALRLLGTVEETSLIGYILIEYTCNVSSRFNHFIKSDS